MNFRHLLPLILMAPFLMADTSQYVKFPARGGGGSGTPGGSNTQVQFNDSGVFGGAPDLTYNKASGLLSVGSAGGFQVDASGNLTKINGITYSFPAFPTATGTTLVALDNFGTLSWAAPELFIGSGILGGTNGAVLFTAGGGSPVVADDPTKFFYVSPQLALGGDTFSADETLNVTGQALIIPLVTGFGATIDDSVDSGYDCDGSTITYNIYAYNVPEFAPYYSHTPAVYVATLPNEPGNFCEVDLSWDDASVAGYFMTQPDLSHYQDLGNVTTLSDQNTGWHTGAFPDFSTSLFDNAVVAKGSVEISAGQIILDSGGGSLGITSDGPGVSDISQDGSIGIGSGLTATSNSIAIGASAFGNIASVAIGNPSVAEASSVAIGSQSSAEGFGISVAIGFDATTSGAAQGSVAIGAGAQVSNDNGIAIGNSTMSPGAFAVAIGGGAKGDGDYSTVLGYQANANSKSATALGFGAFANSNYVVALNAANVVSTGSTLQIEGVPSAFISSYYGSPMLDVAESWITSTLASRTARSIFSEYYISTPEEILRFDAASDQARAAFGGAVVSGTRLTTYTGLATDVGQVVKGFTSQSADLQEWQDSSAAVLALVDKAGNVEVNKAGSGLYIKEGSNARMGKSTLSGGTVTVSNTSVTANTRIFLTVEGGTLTHVGTPYVSARTGSTSFVITSTNALDVSDVGWLLIEPL